MLSTGIPPQRVLATFPTFSTSSSNSGVPSLPILPPLQVTGSSLPAELTSLPTTALSAKLIKKILDLDFIELSDLAPTNLMIQEDAEPSCCHQKPSQRRGPIRDITMWMYCYASLVAILGTKYPDKIGEFMAYQKTIVQAYRRYVGDSWVVYDVCYRRQAAITKSLNWGQVDFNLYNETFTGRAKTTMRCSRCLLEHSFSEPCPFSEGKPTGSATPAKGDGHPQTAICQLYNNPSKDKCYFDPCKFVHKCVICWGSHPRSRCPRDNYHDKCPRRHHSRRGDI